MLKYTGTCICCTFINFCFTTCICRLNAVLHFRTLICTHFHFQQPGCHTFYYSFFFLFFFLWQINLTLVSSPIFYAEYFHTYDQSYSHKRRIYGVVCTNADECVYENCLWAHVFRLLVKTCRNQRKHVLYLNSQSQRYMGKLSQSMSCYYYICKREACGAL